MPFDSTSFVEVQNTTLALLLRARGRVEEGWAQGILNDDGAYCAVGGIREDPERQKRVAAIAYLYAALPIWYKIRPAKEWELIGSQSLSRAENHITCFNDSVRTKHKDVLALYDRAIASCRADQRRG